MSVLHYKANYAEGYDQPGDTWTHDDWYIAYCHLCEADGTWEPPQAKPSPRGKRK